MATSNRPWADITQAEYTAEEWRRACLIDTGMGEPDSKERYKIPVREPSGVLNCNGVQAAAGGHGIAAVRGVSADAKRSAARKLVALYRECNSSPPDSLMTMAGMRDAQDIPSSLTEPHYRSFNPDLEVMPAGKGGDGRTVYGIAVPYNAPARIDDDLVEQFARGAFNHQLRDAARVKFEREHVELGGTLIGVARMLRDDPAGLYGEWRVSKTPVGDETLELVKDGALDQLSVKFRERQNRKLAGGVTERVKADLGAVAVVMQGAYGALAAAAGVRSAQIPIAAETLDLRARAEKYLSDAGLPEARDYDLEVRAIRLGIPL